jgi:hypothetical protein
VCLQAGELYHLQGLSEQEVMQTYTALLVDACRHSDQFWKSSPVSSNAGYWGDGVSSGNQGIRAIAEMVLTCATLLKYSDALTPAETKGCLEKATGALRYVTATHLTGTKACSDGKHWGGNWQSALWTGTFGFGAWLLWDKLDAGLREELERVIAWEADRFLESKPPSGLWGDTKAEENGWNLICIAIAANLFPGHPHAASWENKALEYMMNTLSTPQDLQDKTVVAGRPVCDWVVGANLQPDFTLENHNFFHPSYVACSSYFLTQTAMYYAYARRTIPPAATHHLSDTWRMLQTIILPSAESAFPQGMDWELHGLSFINLFASLGTYQHDPVAGRMEKICLQYMRAWQTMCQGDLAVPGSRLGFTRHAICAEQAAYGYLAHKIFGLAQKEGGPERVVVRGVFDYPFVDFIMQRTEDKFFSFSWKNKFMGMLIPLGKGDQNPFFSAPNANGFTGSMELTPAGDGRTKVLEHERRQLPNGFETAGTLLTHGGRLKQTIKVTSLGEKTVIYEDRIVAMTNITVARERGVPLGIENDPISGGRRTVYYGAGQEVFDWNTPRTPMPLSGIWANVDGRLGIIAVAGSGLVYSQATGYDPHMAVCPDILYGSYCEKPRSYKEGELVAQRIILLFTEVTPAQTATLSQSFKIENRQAGRVLRLELPQGGSIEAPLL